MSETPTASTSTQAEEQQARQAEEQQARQADAAERAVPCPIAYDPQNPASLYMDRGAFRQIFQVGQMLAASLLVPDHLKKKAADCALIVAQAFRWGLDPLAVAQHTYVVHGKLGYEGKLIAALINTSGRTDGPLRYFYEGQGDKRKIIVSGRLRGEEVDRTVEGDFAGWHTKDKAGVGPSDQWKRQPDAMLRYRGAREWARAHMPEVILGIQADEDIQPAPVDLYGQTPAAAAGPDPLAEELKAKLAEQRAERERSKPVPMPDLRPGATGMLPGAIPVQSRESGSDDDEPGSPFAQAVAQQGGPAPDPFTAAKNRPRR